MEKIIRTISEEDNYFNVEYRFNINFYELEYHQVVKINNYYFYVSEEAMKVDIDYMILLRSINISQREGNYKENMILPGSRIEKLNYIINTYTELKNFEKKIKEKEKQDLRLKKIERIINE